MYLRIIISIFVLFQSTGQATECTTRGRFPNNIHSDCRGYTMCLNIATGFTKYDLLCPENSIYSHLETQCTNITTYQCLPQYNCTQEGYYPDESSENCVSYIECVKDLNNIITARLLFCPTDEIFSTTENICINKTLSKCNSVNEKPKVLEVTINNFPSISRNFSVNSGVCLHAMYITIISIIIGIIS